LKNEAIKTVKLGPNQVSCVYFPIKAMVIGKHSLTVKAASGSLSDGIKRELTVYPNGQKQTDVANGIINGKIHLNATIPDYAIPGASKLFIKIYPGTLSQVVDGLEGLLQVPHGCFEQTSSITYPNVLIMKYLKSIKKDKPEISIKAEQYINVGYQRLLTFESPDGGFDWFGGAPANTVLTAYGIMELSDMDSVHEVDPQVIERAKTLLHKRQQHDGSWKSSNYTSTWGELDSKLTTTSYITWCLAEAGDSYFNSAIIGRACDYITQNVDNIRDTYTLALAANALVAAGNKEAAKELLDRLANSAKVRQNKASWPSKSSTLTYTRGDIADAETTALAAYAFFKSGTRIDMARQALTELIARKSPSGDWGTTQATILALKALFAASKGGTGGKTDIRITVNGRSAGTVHLSGDDSDVLQIVDVTSLTDGGRNTIELSVNGEARPAYQIVARYYIPWAQVSDKTSEEINIDVLYSQLKVAKCGTVDVSAVVKSRNTVKMAMVDLGIPPGFSVDTEGLELLKSKRIIDRFELTHRQLILYLHNLRPGRQINIHYRLQVLYPVRATVPVSKAYDYYNPDTVQVIAKPLIIQSN
jgi:uncharacterized protein YfaS (alpha-2-macroglobulin family)